MIDSLFSPSHVHIIAEAGSNHNGNVAMAKNLVTIGGAAGADSVKFQIINADLLYLPRYQKNGNEVANPVHLQRKGEELSNDEWQEVFEHAEERGITVSASIFDPVGLDLLSRMHAPYIKIASTDLNNLPLLRVVAASGIPAVVSTGMSTLSEIEAAVQAFDRESALDRLALLHCVSTYPCPLRDARIYYIQVLREAFGVPVGFSDHTTGIEAAVMAVAQGARLIEKHFTSDKSLPGFDHAHAADGPELMSYVTTVRDAEAACRRLSWKVTDAEAITRIRARRGLYAARDLEPGETVRPEDILVVRPSSELPPSAIDNVIGRIVERAIRRYEPLGLEPSLGPADPTWEAADAYWRTEMAQKGMQRNAQD